MNDRKQDKLEEVKQRKHSYDQTVEEERSGKQSKWPLIFTILIIVALVGAYFIVPGFQKEVDISWDVLTSGDKNRITTWVNQFGIWGPFLIMLAMLAQMFLLVINVVALMLVAIIAYGPVWGSLIAVAAVVFASTVGYLLGRKVGEAGVSKMIGNKTQRKLMDFVDNYGLWAIIIARISPFLSNDAVSIVAGLAKMNYLRFIGATLVGIVPLTILLAWLGEEHERLKSGLIWVSGVSLAVFVGYIFYDKYFKK
jgi:uncharacterized membrane protein YdjX (TVP38/TMEM64 family)